MQQAMFKGKRCIETDDIGSQNFPIPTEGLDFKLLANAAPVHCCKIYETNHK